MPEVGKVETFYNQEAQKPKKKNIVPLLIAVFAVLIVFGSIFTVYQVLFVTTPVEKGTTSQTTTPSKINNDQDLEKAETDLDAMDPDSLEADLDQNDSDAATF